MTKSVTKSEIIKRLAERHGNIYIKDVHETVDVILETISESLAKQDRVELRGFGSFSIRTRAPRKARNPKTNEVVELDSRNAIYFRAGKDLRETVNSTD